MVEQPGGLMKAMARINSLDGVEVTVGIQGTSATTASGEASPAELVEIAVANHDGTETIPPRPFLEEALERHGRKWVKGLDKAVRLMARDDRTGAMGTLQILGVVMVGDVEATLREGPWVPNTDATARAKRSAGSAEAQPLIDAGQLVNSIRSQVEVPGQAPVVVG